MKIAVLNGPNLNLLGERQPEIYGSDTLAEIETKVRASLNDPLIDMVFEQTNDEGEMITWIQDAARSWGCTGIVLNPGAWAHYSIAVMDAIASISIPVVEVHLSNTAAREEFRHRSITAAEAVGKIEGLGWTGYLLAIQYLMSSPE